MLQCILNSLKDGKACESNQLRDAGFDYLIKNSDVFLFYSLKFELSTIDFQYYIADFIDNIKSDRDFYNTVLDICISWYEYFLESKTLFKSTSSLKSELKKTYKKHTGSLNRFDRFFEKIYNAFQEAYNIYDIAFYNPESILNNTAFSDDRKSCYINSTKHYFETIRQANAYYVVVYRNGKPITRVWFLADNNYQHAAIFNPYGFYFKDLGKLFGDKNSFKTDQYAYMNLEKVLKIHINNDDILISSNVNDYNCFTYDLLCPTCKSTVNSSQIFLRYTPEEKVYKMKCVNCERVVYSSIYKSYIDEEQAIYSKYLDTYIYKTDAVYSNYLNSYVFEFQARMAWNSNTNGFDWVPKEFVIYSNELNRYLIRDQVEDKNAVCS